ncbi:MAG: bifunctional glutamate N-acetyltransferase/amino-acid acetyltransferase ArgJ [Candidatus Omnitrophica bacterium]|nr:bifunctional glutamate N-acetyltransferase/amino-acid acetyltransferase ArgJ [Candidatus Omnitrophota bacterium]
MSFELRTVSGGVTAAKGFLACGMPCGIKRTGRPDLALIWAERPARAAAVFTRNRFRAHPVRLDMARLRQGVAQAVLINSGNANCLTGRRGYRRTLLLSKRAAKILKVPEYRLFLFSTGVIGIPLPADKIEMALPELVEGLSREGAGPAAQAILTTDRVRKEIAVRFKAGGRTVTLGGMAKGSGMIQPNMATMLAFLTTDAVIGLSALRKALAESCRRSFNHISVDGQMSTNDSVLLLANGLALNRAVRPAGRDFEVFQRALDFVTARLAEMIVSDGEGVTRLMKVCVRRAASPDEAERVALSVVNSPLVKTMLSGGDPNWGRVLQAVGATRVPFAPDKVKVSFDSHPVFAKGERTRYSRSKLKGVFKRRIVPILIELGRGKYSCEKLGADLSPLYVRVNARYGT